MKRSVEPRLLPSAFSCASDAPNGLAVFASTQADGRGGCSEATVARAIDKRAQL